MNPWKLGLAALVLLVGCGEQRSLDHKSAADIKQAVATYGGHPEGEEIRQKYLTEAPPILSGTGDIQDSEPHYLDYRWATGSDEDHHKLSRHEGFSGSVEHWINNPPYPLEGKPCPDGAAPSDICVHDPCAHAVSCDGPWSPLPMPHGEVDGVDNHVAPKVDGTLIRDWQTGAFYSFTQPEPGNNLTIEDPVVAFDAKIMAICGPADKAITEVLKQYPQFKAMITCGRVETMGGDHKTTKTYPLTVDEITQLDYFEAKGLVNYHKEEEFKNGIYAKRGIKVPGVADKCWHFIGIILHDQFITEDLPDPEWAARNGCELGLLLPVPK